jgi:predicted ferric reductase
LKTWHAIALLTGISTAVTLYQIPSETWFTSAALSLSLGVTAVSMMGVAALMGARLRVVESLFGGLDRVYLTHKWLGVYALAFACVHFVFKAGAPEWDTAEILPISRSAARLVRQLSLVALLFIVILALNRNIRYHVWRWWHKLSGPLFVIVVLHWLSFKSPVTLASPVGVWLSTVSALGIAGALYKLLLYPVLSSSAEYRIVGASPAGSANALHLELAPVRHPIDFTPGQFAFLSLHAEGLREPHPFTIASAGDGKGHVHFLIRNLGDYTQRLCANAAAGMHATVYAPYGRFERQPNPHGEIWIAGGVGISPFVAWLQDETSGDLSNVSLFYFFTPGREFPTADVIAELTRKRGAQFMPISSGPSNADFLARFAAIARQAGDRGATISFCGPKGLLLRVQQLMREHRIPEANLRHEYFEFR